MRAAAGPRPRPRGSELARASDELAGLAQAVAPVDVDEFKPLESALSDWRTPRTAADLGPRFPALLHSAHKTLRGDLERDAFTRALVADLASGLRHRVNDLALPAEVIARVPAALDRLRAFLSERREGYDLGDEWFLRDVRFAAGWTVPCGSEVIDLRSRVSVPACFQIALRARALRLALQRLKPGEREAWFAPHTESRYLDEFDEVGWETTYRNVGSLLRLHPAVVGVVGYSWFYDPQLEAISPRLAYLRRRPLQGGAIFLRGHTSDFDVRNATAKSQTRRRLYEAGEYTPVAYKMVWLRSHILHWAERTRQAAD